HRTPKAFAGNSATRSCIAVTRNRDRKSARQLLIRKANRPNLPASRFDPATGSPVPVRQGAAHGQREEPDARHRKFRNWKTRKKTNRSRRVPGRGFYSDRVAVGQKPERGQKSTMQ